MPAKKAAVKGKRYSDAEKAEILSFIEQAGYGGAAAASKKYGVSALTLSAWKKKAGGSTGGSIIGNGKSLDLEIATAKWLGKQGFEYEIFKSLSSGAIERKTSKGIEALALFGEGDYTVSSIGKGGEPVVSLPLSKLLELTKTKA